MGRGLAALAVTLFHTSGMFADPRFDLAPPFWDWTHRGDLGVDFFFVLSGFIILHAHRGDLGQPGQLPGYAIKRFVRIYPLYWIFTALILMGAALTGGISAMPQGAGDLVSITTLIRFTGIDTPVGTAWTLFHEILFYAFFALLLVRRRLGVAALTLWFGVVALNLHYAPFGGWSFTRTLLSAHNLGFLFGIAAWYVSPRLDRTAAIACLIAGVLLVPLLLLGEGGLGRADALQLGFTIAFAFIIAGAVAMERHGLIGHSRPLMILGNASYTLYLAHENVGATLLKVAVKLRLTDWIDLRILYIACLAAIILFSLVFYRLVEKPLLIWLRRAHGVRRQVPPPQPTPAPA